MLYITALDHEFGRLVDYLKDNGLLENTIIIFTSDHGEMMGSQGRMTKTIWYEESIGVPCLIGGADALMDKMHTALKKHLDEQNDPFL